MVDFDVYGIAASILIAAIVQVVKKLFGIEKTEPIIIISLVVGLVLSVCVKLATQNAVFDEWFGVIISGLLVALAAMGSFDFATKLVGPVAERTVARLSNGK